MKQILVSFSNFEKNCPRAYRLLQEQGFSIRLSQQAAPYWTYEQYCGVIREVDALIAGLDTLDERIFSMAPRLRIVARMGVGFDGVDLEAARRRGIYVTTTRGGNAVSVAEQTVGMMLAVYRNLAGLDTALRRGQWVRYAGHELYGKTVGLVGFGDIGKAVAQRLGGFGVRLLACRGSGKPAPEAAALGVAMTDLPALLRESDVVSLHLPGTEQNAGLFGEAAFAAMKPGSVLINTARGILVDSRALLAAVRSGKLAGAAVDVYRPEPPGPEEPLLQDPRILCTPHSASETKEAYARCGDTIAGQILDVFSGRTPENWMNPW